MFRLDDACAYVRHSLNQPEYRVWSELAFGGKHGCFEMPSATRDPTSNIDCPDITPLKFSNNEVNREAMLVDSRLVHPDTGSTLTKYVLGTRLQMRKGKTSHKLKTCEYHDVNLAVQGKLLKTMTQEAMQVLDLSKHISLISLTTGKCINNLFKPKTTNKLGQSCAKLICRRSLLSKICFKLS